MKLPRAAELLLVAAEHESRYINKKPQHTRSCSLASHALDASPTTLYVAFYWRNQAIKKIYKTTIVLWPDLTHEARTNVLLEAAGLVIDNFICYL